MAPWSSLNRQGRRIAAQRALRGATLAGVAAVALVGAYALGAATGSSPGCYEDEVYAVQIDTNPNHGLTWACENNLGYSLRMVED